MNPVISPTGRPWLLMLRPVRLGTHTTRASPLVAVDRGGVDTMRTAAMTASALLLLTGCAGESQEETVGVSPGDSAGEVREEAAETSTSITDVYIALGDSYAAMGGRDQPLRGEPFCLRSSGNYPELLDADVTDLTCQGAVTGDLFEPRTLGERTLSAQLDALTEDTTLVTLSIGGNDLGFGEVAGCIRERIAVENTDDCVDLLGETIGERLDQLPPQLDRVHEGIRDRAGNAQVVVTGYLPLVSTGDCPELGEVSEADRRWAVRLTEQINQTVRDAAERHGAIFVLPDDADEHTSCAPPEERWADIQGQQTDAYPLHPTSAGHEAMAAAVRDALDLEPVRL